MLSKQILYCVFNFALCLQCTATSLSGNTSLISTYKPKKTVNITDVTNLPEHKPEVAVKWTFLVYLMGSDLESKSNAGSSDLLEMMAVGSNPNVNVIVTTGGANKDNSSQGGINWRKINRWKIEKNNATPIAYNAPTNDMANPAMLTDFVTWGQNNYPAEKYALILWDHGGATDGYGHDENSHNMLSIMQIRKALENAYAVTQKRFELFGFDACLMANLEALYNFRTFSRYYIASEDLEPGHGWNYTPIISALANGQAVDGVALGKVIADGFIAQAQQQKTTGITLSLTDNTKLDPVFSALDGFIKSLSKSSRSRGVIKFLPVAKGRSNTEEYGKSAHQPEASSDVIDIGDFAKNVKQHDPSVTAEADALIGAINNAILYDVKDKQNPNATGLTLFLPFHKLANQEAIPQILNKYNSIAFPDFYRQFIRNFVDDALADDTKPEVPEGLQENDNALEAVCTSIDYDEAFVVLMTPDEDEDDVINFMGVMLPDAVESTDEGISIQYQWDGQWIGLNGEPASVGDIYETEFEDEDGNLYPVTMLEIPVMLNDEIVTLEFIIDEDGSFELNNIIPEADENGLIPKETITIEPGDIITLLYEQYNTTTDESLWKEGAQFEVDSEEDLELEVINLPVGQYLIGYSITDLYQNEEFFLNENVFEVR